MATDSSVVATPKWMYWVGWVLSVLPAPLLVMSAVSKFTLSPEVVKGFGDLGWKTDVAMALGIVELVSLVLYLIPQTAVLGAVLLTGYLGGACATHVRIADYGHFWVPVAMGVVLWLGLFLRDARVRALIPWRSSPAAGVYVLAASIALLAAPALAEDVPLLKVLDRFSASSVPASGPKEIALPPRSWPEPSAEAAAEIDSLPGDGIAQHPMLYAGEGYNTLFLVKDGKVIWSYSSGRGGEIDDIWLMSNGHILYTRQGFLEEITPDKQVVWHYDAPAGTEIHTCQPIGLDKVLFVQNGLPPKAILINKQTGAVEMEHALPAKSDTDSKSVHPQFRRFRMTKDGTYLGAHLNMGKVVEYDKDFKEIWSYEIPSPWSAVRLQNGNTLINDEKDRLVREVNPQKETVWEFKQSELPVGVTQRNNQTADRLANGNTIICSSTAGAKGEDRIKLAQVVEVTPDKKVVWVLQDWKNLGPATTVQLLDEPGMPENPGDLQR